jgi:hypothetical protein
MSTAGRLANARSSHASPSAGRIAKPGANACRPAVAAIWLDAVLAEQVTQAIELAVQSLVSAMTAWTSGLAVNCCSGRSLSASSCLSRSRSAAALSRSPASNAASFCCPALRGRTHARRAGGVPAQLRRHGYGAPDASRAATGLLRQLEMVVRLREQPGEGHNVAAAARLIRLQDNLADAESEITGQRRRLGQCGVQR